MRMPMLGGCEVIAKDLLASRGRAMALTPAQGEREWCSEPPQADATRSPERRGASLHRRRMWGAAAKQERASKEAAEASCGPGNLKKTAIFEIQRRRTDGQTLLQKCSCI